MQTSIVTNFVKYNSIKDLENDFVFVFKSLEKTAKLYNLSMELISAYDKWIECCNNHTDFTDAMNTAVKGHKFEIASEYRDKRDRNKDLWEGASGILQEKQEEFSKLQIEMK